LEEGAMGPYNCPNQEPGVRAYSADGGGLYLARPGNGDIGGKPLPSKKKTPPFRGIKGGGNWAPRAGT